MGERDTTRAYRPLHVRVLVGALLCAGGCGVSITTEPEPESSQPTLEATDSTGQSALPQPPSDAVDVPASDVDTLFRSPVSGLETARREVLRSADAWTATWADLTALLSSTDGPPEVDFETTQVLVLAMGVRPTGGYRIETGPMNRDDDTLYVVVRELSPGAGCVTTQALTQPTLVLAVPRLGDAVEFIEESVVVDCS